MRYSAAAALLLLCACAPSSPRVAQWRHEREERLQKGLSDWGNITNNMMVEKYGPPDRIDPSRMVWEHRGPWKRIAVWDELDFFDDDRASNNIEETIAYKVSEEKRSALFSFSRSLYVSADGAEMSARSTDEEHNFLMLNLADQIVKGLLTPKDARVMYLQTLKQANAGKTPDSMRQLLFQ